MIYLVFFIGTLFGSFYLVFSLRSLKNENYINSKSHCDSCNKELKWYNLIPILSFVFQRGRCSFCKEKISSLTIIIEVSTGLLFAYMFYLYGLSYEFYIGVILSSLFITICITDFKAFIIQNEPLLISIISIIILILIYQDTTFLITHIISGTLIFLFFMAIKKIGDLLFKKESLGGGDIKFSFIIGLTVGFQLALYSIILSAFLALPTSLVALETTKNKEVPYGPFLIGALLIVFLNADKFPII